jgi:predicted DNA-binding transcriptional regulator AlpA
VTERDRPPAFPSRSTLAHELDCAESTIDDMVKRGVLPRPLQLSSGCVRWCWADVETALSSLKAGASTATESDPYLTGAKNAAQTTTRGR